MLKYTPFSHNGLEIGYEIYDSSTGQVLMRAGGYHPNVAPGLNNAKRIFEILEKQWN